MKDHFFLTTYRKHYTKKPIKFTVPSKVRQEFADPIAIGQKEYLFLDKTELKPVEEDGRVYFEKFKQKHKEMEKAYSTSNPLDTYLIIKHKAKKEKTTEYQATFCWGVRAHKEEDFRLPDDAKIPQTTQRSSYKNPLDYTPRALDPVEVVVPPTNLGSDQNIRGILCTKTGNSEYMDHIGTLGHLIVKSQWEQRRN